jgi:hypothetical protein
MARIQHPPPGRLIASVIYSHIDAVADALTMLEKQFGRILGETCDIRCSSAHKYAEEMGEELQRRFFAFEKPVQRDSLPAIKSTCHKIEKQLGDRIHDYTFRAANIDPGILTTENLAMASHRDYNHRIYLGRGVYAEIQLIYARGQYTRLPWTEPDFCHHEAIELFLRVRESFELISEECTPSPPS